MLICPPQSLARALYARRDILILDDALSELDATTENAIFHELLGMLGTSHGRKTVILATSLTHRIPYAAHIVVLGADGKVVQQGSFKELQSTEGYVKGLSLPEPKIYEPVPEVPSNGRTSSADSYPSDHIKAGSGAETSDTPSTPLEPEKPSPAKEEKVSRGDGDLTIYAYYFRSVGIPLSMLFCVLTAAYTFCTAFPSKRCLH